MAVQVVMAATAAAAEPDGPTVVGGSPIPKVPTTAQRSPSRADACAHHQAVEVLPLVPVTAITSIAAEGCP